MQHLPQAFVNQLHHLVGDDAPAFLDAIEAEPVSAVRLNPRKKSDPAFDGKPVPWCDEGLFLEKRPSFIFDPLFHAGAYYVQEASSMFLDKVLKQILPGFSHPIKVLDLCAAPGGKSTLVSARLRPHDLLVSNEIIRSRVSALQENMMRWGSPDTIISNNDPKQFGSLPSFFDVIILDAPCSGEGMFRKDKKAVDEWSPDHVTLCASRQQRIIDDILPSLKPGGFLVYSTCTFNMEENETQVLRLKQRYGMNTVPIETESAWGITVTGTFKNESLDAYRFYPHKTKGEGLFMCCMQKPADAETEGRLKHPAKLNFISRNQKALIAPWLSIPEDYSCLTDKEEIIAIPSVHETALALLKASLHVVSAGTKMGTMIKDQLIPDHALALSNILNANIPRTELALNDALIFLKKGSPAANLFPGTGWFLVTYQGLGLGWVKAMPGRVNNYLPVNLRILKDLQS